MFIVTEFQLHLGQNRGHITFLRKQNVCFYVRFVPQFQTIIGVFTKVKITKCYFRFEVHFITVYSILDIDLVQFSFD